MARATLVLKITKEADDHPIACIYIHLVLVRCLRLNFGGFIIRKHFYT